MFKYKNVMKQNIRIKDLHMIVIVFQRDFALLYFTCNSTTRIVQSHSFQTRV